MPAEPLNPLAAFTGLQDTGSLEIAGDAVISALRLPSSLLGAMLDTSSFSMEAGGKVKFWSSEWSWPAPGHSLRHGVRLSWSALNGWAISVAEHGRDVFTGRAGASLTLAGALESWGQAFARAVEKHMNGLECVAATAGSVPPGRTPACRCDVFIPIDAGGAGSVVRLFRELARIEPGCDTEDQTFRKALSRAADEERLLLNPPCDIRAGIVLLRSLDEIPSGPSPAAALEAAEEIRRASGLPYAEKPAFDGEKLRFARWVYAARLRLPWHLVGSVGKGFPGTPECGTAMKMFAFPAADDPQRPFTLEVAGPGAPGCRQRWIFSPGREGDACSCTDTDEALALVRRTSRSADAFGALMGAALPAGAIPAFIPLDTVRAFHGKEPAGLPVSGKDPAGLLSGFIPLDSIRTFYGESPRDFSGSDIAGSRSLPSRLLGAALDPASFRTSRRGLSRTWKAAWAVPERTVLSVSWGSRTGWKLQLAWRGRTVLRTGGRPNLSFAGLLDNSRRRLFLGLEKCFKNLPAAFASPSPESLPRASFPDGCFCEFYFPLPETDLQRARDMFQESGNMGEPCRVEAWICRCACRRTGAGAPPAGRRGKPPAASAQGARGAAGNPAETSSMVHVLKITAPWYMAERLLERFGPLSAPLSPLAPFIRFEIPGNEEGDVAVEHPEGSFIWTFGSPQAPTPEAGGDPASRPAATETPPAEPEEAGRVSILASSASSAWPLSSDSIFRLDHIFLAPIKWRVFYAGIVPGPFSPSLQFVAARERDLVPGNCASLDFFSFCRDRPCSAPAGCIRLPKGWDGSWDDVDVSPLAEAFCRECAAGFLAPALWLPERSRRILLEGLYRRWGAAAEAVLACLESGFDSLEACAGIYMAQICPGGSGGGTAPEKAIHGHEEAIAELVRRGLDPEYQRETFLAFYKMFSAHLRSSPQGKPVLTERAFANKFTALSISRDAYGFDIVPEAIVESRYAREDA